MPDRYQYTVGWICAIRAELIAAKLFLDEKYEQLEEIPLEDNNIYAVGKIGFHNVVVAALPDGEYGIEVAGTVARDLLRSFPNIKIGLMVGIGGGVPSAKHDIRLGDVVVSATSNGEPGVFQYDFGKSIQNGEFQQTRFLDQTPRLLRGAVTQLRTDHDMSGHKIQRAIDAILEENQKVRKSHQRPPRNTDRLYVSDFVHQSGTDAACEESCGDDESICISRPPRDENEDDPAIHYGLIASGNTLMKDAQARDRLARSKDVLCFEMEAAGLMNHFPCLVIRGICDYADSHKQKCWQGYAAMTAAAYAKDVLNHIPARKVHHEKTIADMLDAIGKDMNQILGGTHERDQVGILDWITLEDYGLEHSNLLEQREKGTGQWFLDSKEFKKWFKNDNETLFCPGIPGAGKTVLASLVIDHIRSNLRNNTDASLGYIYFDHRQREQHDSKALIASLLRQLAASHSVLPDTMRKLYDTHRYKRTRPSIEELTQCLRAVVETHCKVYIVVDALDECTDGSDERQTKPLHKFLDIIFQLQATHNMNLLATSRDIPDISRTFEEALVQRIWASPDDIRTYVSIQVQQMGGKVQGDDELQEAIQNTIIEAVDGMFLMARLYMQSLRACMMTKRKVKEMLERFSRQCYPSDINQTYSAYDEAVMRIDSQNKECQMIARHALLWITYAERPLDAEELTHALAVERGTRSFDEDNMARIEDVVSVCAGLVALDDASGIIRLVHHTAYEYFRDTRSNWFPETHSEIMFVCVTYISYEAFASENPQSEYGGTPHSLARTTGSDSVFDFNKNTSLEDLCYWETRESPHSLYSYASTYWGHHARQAGASTLDACVIKFLENLCQVRLSWEVLCREETFSRRRSPLRKLREISGIHVACYFGIQEAVRQLLINGANINQDDGRGWMPLCYAAYGGHEMVTRLLLKYDNQTYPETVILEALYLALERGHEEVALRLLERDVSLDSDETQDLLMRAAANGLDAALERLLSLRADINSVNMEMDLVTFCVAAVYGQVTTVKLLLERGVQIDGVPSSHAFSGTALLQAAFQGHTEVITLLLDYGANPELGRDSETPLMSASSQGHLEAVRVLIERGANVEGPSESSVTGTPLFAAAGHGHTHIVRFLLSRGASINRPSLEGYTPLFWAAYQQNSKTVQLLLDRGADTEVANDHGDLPIHEAAQCLAKKNLLLLIRGGAWVQATNKEGDGALHKAAYVGLQANIRVLISYGANLEAANSQNSTPLHKSVHGGHLHAARLLLRRCANVNAVDRSYGTSLHYACYYNRLALVQVLIKNGAGVNTADDCGNTPLLCAVSGLSRKTQLLLYTDREMPLFRCCWRKKVIQKLVDSGANISAKNSLGNTALHIAAHAGYGKAILALIQFGADIEARNNRGETALYIAGLNTSSFVARVPDFRFCNGTRERYVSSGLPFDESICASNGSICGSDESGDTTDIRSEEGDDGDSMFDRSSETLSQARIWYNLETASSSSCDRLVSHPGSAGSYGSRTSRTSRSCERDASVLDYLLESGADTNIADDEGLTLLWRLAKVGDEALVRQLLRHGANTEATDCYGRTTLHISVLKGSFYIVKLLLNHKAEIEATDDDGRTPLWAAVWWGETEIVQLLLEHGASFEAINICGCTPLQVAAMRGHDEVEEILIEKGARDEDCFGFQRLFCEENDASRVI